MSNANTHSIIAFPENYVVMDFETTGLNREYDEIIEIGALKVENGKVVDTFSTFVKPSLPIDDFITELTGITNEMLEDAPEINSVIPNFLDFIGGSVIIGHNVSFDIGFLNNNTTQPIENDYVDTLRLCRKLFKDMQYHRLSDMTERFGISRGHAHRSIDDCAATLSLFEICRDEALKQFSDVESFIQSFKNKSRSHGRIDINAITADPNLADEDCLFYDKECVFTGALEKMKRADAMQLVVNIGGRVGNNVTKKTNFLILGNNDYCKSIKDGKSSKHKKAEQLKLKGQDIEVISEQTFYDVLGI